MILISVLALSRTSISLKNSPNSNSFLFVLQIFTVSKHISRLILLTQIRGSISLNFLRSDFADTEVIRVLVVGLRILGFQRRKKLKPRSLLQGPKSRCSQIFISNQVCWC